MTALHTLGILSTSFMRNAFPTEGVSTYAERLLAAFPSLCSLTHAKPSQLGWGWVIVEARSSDAALHHSPSWSNSPYIAWRCVGSLSCWKTNDCPTKCKPDGMAYHCRMLWEPCWLSAPWILNKSTQYQQSTSHLLLHASRWEPHMRRSSVHLLYVSQRQVVGTKHLKFGLIRMKDRFPLV